MIAEVKYYHQNPASDYACVTYIVEVSGAFGFRGLFTALSHHEAEDFAERINEYPRVRAELLEARAEVERLKARLRKRTRKPTRKRKGGKR